MLSKVKLSLNVGVEYFKKLCLSHAAEVETNPTEDGAGTYKIDNMKGQFVFIA